MSTETIAAVWGGVSGGVVSILGGVGVLLLGRYLRRRGRLECRPERWRLSWLQYRTPNVHFMDDPVQGAVEKTYYRRFSYDPLREGMQEYVNFVEYALVVEVINHAEVEVVLRDVHTAFVKDGGVLFTHRPFDPGKTTDPSGITEEDARDVPHVDPDNPGMTLPDPRLEPVGTIPFPSRSPVRFSLKGYLRTPELHHVRGGYDEVRLRGTRGDGTLLDVAVPESGHVPT